MQLTDDHFDPSTALLLFGGGGHGKTLIDLVRAGQKYQWVGVLDEQLPPGSDILGVPVLGGTDVLAGLYRQGIRLAVNGVGGIGHPEIRQRVFDLLARAGFTCPAVVHPRAWVEPSATLEDGVQVLAQAYVSSAVRIGYGSVLNAGVVVSHDCTTGRCVNLSPGAMLAGGVHLANYVQVGMAATINLNISIGEGARIGNGATVKGNVPAGAVVFAGTIWPPRRNSDTPLRA